MCDTIAKMSNMKQKILSVLPSYMKNPDAFTHQMLEQIMNKHIPVYLIELKEVCLKKPVSELELELISHPSTAEWMEVNKNVFSILGMKPFNLWAAIHLVQDLDATVWRYTHYPAQYIQACWNQSYQSV